MTADMTADIAADTAPGIAVETWAALRVEAIAAMKQAYAPYSGFAVGAAALVDDGRVVTGCNVENASYGLTLCAECGLVSALHASGGGRLVAVAVVDAAGAPCPPCGRCRQLLFEHGGPTCLLDAGADHQPLRMDVVLPSAFVPQRLHSAPSPTVPPTSPPTPLTTHPPPSP